MPTSGGNQVTYVRNDSAGNVWAAYASFFWDNNARMGDLRGSNVAYEHSTMFEPNNCFSQEKTGAWDTNLPSGGNKYLDTTLSDSDPNRDYAAGVADSNSLTAGISYYTRIYFHTACDPDNIGAPAIRYKVVGQRGYRNESYCWAGYENCVFSGSQADMVPYAAGYEVAGSPLYSWGYNQNANYSFESGGAGWATLQNGGTASVPSQVLQQAGTFEKLYFGRFNCGAGNPGCKMYQRRTFSTDPNDTWTHEVALRCLATYASCPVTIGATVSGINPQEVLKRTYTVPGDGYWHVYGFKWLGQNYQHSTVEWAVYNNTSSQHLDVEFTTLKWSEVRTCASLGTC